MARRLAGLIGLAASCTLMVAAASADVFNSPDGMFTVEFPASPSLLRLQGQTTRGTHYEEYRWSVGNKDGYWGVLIFAYANPRKTNYDAIIASTVAAANGRLISNQPIMQSGVPGREIVIDHGKDGVVRERILWAAGRLYFVVYGGDSLAAASAANVDEFLISFEAAK